MNFMGIDIGTSGCKVAVFDSDGRQLVRAYREYSTIFTPDGGVELDSTDVIHKCFELIRECNSAINGHSIKALAISSQGEAFTAIGQGGRSLCNAMISSDLRALPYVQKWTRKFGEEKLYQITGHTAHPMFTFFKLLWLKDNKPDVWKNARKFLCFEDLLQYHLGIDPAIGWPLAGRTMLFDIKRHCWNEEILTLLGIREEQLARPLQSGKIAGLISNSIARNLGFADNTLVVCGGHDQICSALGAGAVKPGMAMYASGTVECITPCFDHAIFSNNLRKSNLCTYDHVLNEMYATVAYSLTGGNILKWFRDEFGREEIASAQMSNKDVYEIILQNSAKKPTDLLVLPYFTPSGTPYFDADTKGAIFGLRISTQRGEFIRALLEGVSYEMRLNLEILESSGYRIDELFLVGGGAKSRIWSQIKADVTGKKISIPAVTEAGCLGAAILACASYSGSNIHDLARKWIKIKSTLIPNEEYNLIYSRKFEDYKKLYSKIRKVMIYSA